MLLVKTKALISFAVSFAVIVKLICALFLHMRNVGFLMTRLSLLFEEIIG